MIKSSTLVIISAGLLSMTSCVPKRQLDDLQSKYDIEKEKNTSLSGANIKLEEQNKELSLLEKDNKVRMEALVRDTSLMGRSLRQLNYNYEQLNKTYRELLELQDKLKRGSDAETAKYLKELEKTKADLQAQEDQLRKLKSDLEIKEKSLNELSQSLSEREAKVKELQSIIDKKDSVANALKKKIQAALLGFENKGLTVTLKDGKVYVSLENELLFSPGSYNVGEKGTQALKQLAKVLNENQDINITVEGHTDTDKYVGSGGLKDNWDLSVIRATQIVKLLQDFKVDPKRLTATGKGEYLPIDPGKTPEAKQKNRRTEIILTPKLDELMQLLEK